ncbi:MAG: efflux RND transporter periplasmic adaptor subunit [Betaproteobacteria bacterium]|nr:efflux RND transporter periplasmic adaptor subunit [Betaproteobacteria bacterium]
MPTPTSEMQPDRPADALARWRRRLLVLVILAAGAGGFVALQVLKPRPAVSPPAKQSPLVRVAEIEVREGALTVTGHGLVKPRAEVALAAEVSGRVTFVSRELVTGGRFARGDVLVRLDPEPFRAALAQALAERQSAQASLELAEQLLKRTEQLIAQNFLSRQTLDERVASRDQARAQLARAEAVEKSRRIDLDRTEIRAPFKGRVFSEKVARGDTVQPGKELARIFADDAVEIAVSLTDREVALIADPWRAPSGGKQPGAGATVTVEHGGARYRWPARVDRVEAAVDSATRTFNVVVRVDNPGARGEPRVSSEGAAAPPLLVGMYATVEITGRDAGRYALVPRRALRDGGRVWLLADGNIVAIRPVTVLYDAGDHAAVTGLDAGSRVIVSDLKVVTEGMPVRVLADTGRAP